MEFQQPWNTLTLASDFLTWLKTEALPTYVNTCRWFAGKARPQKGFAIIHVLEQPIPGSTAYWLVIRADYTDGGEAENYLLPLSFITDNQDIIAKGIIVPAIGFGGEQGLLIDGIYDARFREALFTGLSDNTVSVQGHSEIVFQKGKFLKPSTGVASYVLPVDSSNSAMIFNDTYFLKLYRKLFDETNPEVDMVAFISENSTFENIPAYAGSIVWKQANLPDITLGMMQGMIDNKKDSWSLTGDFLNDFMFSFVEKSFAINENVFEQVELLAQRTAEMHLALYAPQSPEDAFIPEKFTDEYRQFLLKRFSDLLERRYALLVDNYLTLDPEAQKLAWRFMEAKELIDEFTAAFMHRPLESLRIRVHGDYHLGQVLATPNEDYVIIDFEGEPESSITDRKIKHSPLKDVAGMIRSYHYAVSAKLFDADETRQADPKRLLVASDRWYKLMKDTFMEAYLGTIGSPHALFKNNTEINYLMLIYLLEKAVYELGYELSYRPTWVNIPLKGIVDVIREIEKLKEA